MSVAIQDHSKRAHSDISPSGLHRIDECPASAIPMPFDVPEKPSEDADRGTRFHELMDKLLKVKKKTYSRYRTIFKEANKRELTFDEPNREMINYAVKAMQYIRDLKRKVGLENVIMEEAEDRVRLQFTKQMEGNIDYFLYYKKGNKTGLIVLDFKYGKWAVAVKDNLQLVCYALGVISDYNLEPEIISTVIYQPRIENKKTAQVHHYTLKELRKFENRIKAIEERGVEAIKKGFGEEKVGGHCYFCKRKVICATYRNQFNASSMEVFSDIAPQIVNTLPAPSNMTMEQIEFIVEKSSDLQSWIKEINALALNLAKKGMLPTYTYTEEEGNRKWISDEEAVEKSLISKGITNPFKKSLKGIGEIEKALGKGAVDDLTTRHQSKLVLVKKDLSVIEDTSIFNDIGDHNIKAKKNGVKEEKKSKRGKGNNKKSTS